MIALPRARRSGAVGVELSALVLTPPLTQWRGEAPMEIDSGRARWRPNGAAFSSAVAFVVK